MLEGLHLASGIWQGIATANGAWSYNTMRMQGWLWLDFGIITDMAWVVAFLSGVARLV